MIPGTWSVFLKSLQSSTKSVALQVSTAAWKDTTSRYPVWNNNILPELNSNTSYPEFWIQGSGQEKMPNGYTKKLYHITKPGYIPEVLYNKLAKVTYYFRDIATGLETVSFGTKENNFSVPFFIKDPTLVFATVELKNGQKVEVSIVN